MMSSGGRGSQGRGQAAMGTERAAVEHPRVMQDVDGRSSCFPCCRGLVLPLGGASSSFYRHGRSTEAIGGAIRHC